MKSVQQPEGELATRAARGVLWGQLGGGVQIALSVIVSIGMVRYLGPTLYGAYSLIISTAGIAVTLTSLGIGPTLGRFLPLLKQQNEEKRPVSLVFDALLVRLLIGFGAALLLIAFSKRLALVWNLRWDLVWPVMLGLIILFQGTSDVLRRALIGVLAVKSAAIADATAPVAGLAVLLLAWWLLPPSLPVGLLIGTVMLLTSSGMLLWFVRSYLIWHGGRNSYPEIGRFAATAWGISLVTFGLENQIDLVLIGLLIRDPTEAGYYALAASLIIRLATFALAWTSSSLPALAEARLDGMERLNAGWQRYMRLLMLLIVPVFVFVAGYARPIVLLLAGQQYLLAVPTLRVMAAYYVVAGLLGIGLGTNYLFTVGEQRLDLVLRVVGGVANIVLDIWWIRSFGIIGAALATAAANIIILSAEQGIVLIRYRAQFPFAPALKLISASIVALILSATLSGFSNLLVGTLAYGITIMVLFRILQPWSQDDTDLLRRVSPTAYRLIGKLLFRPL